MKKRTEASPRRDPNLLDHHRLNLEPLLGSAPFILHLTERKDKQGTVLVVRERMASPVKSGGKSGAQEKAVHRLEERGALAGENQRRLLPIVSRIVGEVRSESGIPLELQRYLTPEGMRLRVRLPLDEEAGAKLALIFKLQERLFDLDRAELVALRLQRFTREEASYWLTRITRFDAVANRWALAGMRTMLGGIERKETVAMLKRLKNG